MEDIIHAFGIDARLIIIQIVNFGLLMAALGYFLYKPVLNLLRLREEKISQGLKDAEAAAQAKVEADSERQAILVLAHGDAESISARAKESAAKQADGILGEAHTKAAAVLVEAQAQRELIKEQARKESEREIAEVAVLLAEKTMRSRA
jgi:F-type H+-transporting ATPase subunit b